jgi:membrane-bound serine protease (ClpP class)
VPGFEISWQVIAVVAVTSLVFTAVIAHLAVRSHRRKVETGRNWMIGAKAEVQDWNTGPDGGQGHVFIHGERWRAVSDTPLEKGQQVRITGVDGLTARVEPFRTDST